MAFMIEEVFLRVKELSDKIDDLYDINPVIKLRFFSKDIEMNGSCIVTYQKTNMYIELNIPHDLKMTRSNKVLLDVMLLHEYCHFIEALGLTGPERKSSSDLYNRKPQEKTRDEKKTWRQTKKLAQALGLWDRKFYNAVNSCTYVSDLTYK